MRILLLSAVAGLAVAPVSAQTELKVAPAKCKPAADVADHRGGATAPRKLGEMPPANQIYTVYNEVDGCPQPVSVRRGIGANPRQPVAPTRSPPRATRAR